MFLTFIKAKLDEIFEVFPPGTLQYIQNIKSKDVKLRGLIPVRFDYY